MSQGRYSFFFFKMVYAMVHAYGEGNYLEGRGKCGDPVGREKYLKATF